VLFVAATTSGNALGAVGSRWWDRVINGLVPTALIAAIVAYALPFIASGQGQYPVDLDSGLSAFFIGFFVLTAAPLDPFFEMFSLPLIAAFVGLMHVRRRGWLGSLSPLVCSVVGLILLGSAYFWDQQDHLAYGYFAAEASFLIAAVASAVRLIRLRRNRALWDAKDEPRFMPAASASQELLSRYRNNW
jgi:peptidoglycan/LPS O-acetylase OafA/YrhL